MPNSQQENTNDTDDTVSVVTLAAEEPNDSSTNTKLLVILTSFLVAVTFPTLLYFFAPYQLITLGSALLNLLTIEASVTATLITGALIMGTGIFTVFSLLGAAISYVFEDPKPSENSVNQPETLEQQDLKQAEDSSDDEATASPAVDSLTPPPPALTLPASKHSATPTTAAGATAPVLQSSLPITTNPITAIAAPVPSSITTALEVRTPVLQSDLPVTNPGATVPAPVVPSSAITAIGAETTAIRAEVPRATLDLTTTAARTVSEAASSSTSVTVLDPHINLGKALAVAQSFMMQHPTAFCFGGGIIALATLYLLHQLTNSFFAGDSLAANVGGTIASAASAAFSPNTPAVTCLYPSTNQTIHLPVPQTYCPDDSVPLPGGTESMTP